MQEQKFEGEVSALWITIIDAVEGHFVSRGMKFSREAYLNQASADHEQMCRELLFFGTDTFPTVSESNLAA
ncbi:hypothetical protein [Galbibacter sp. BG1]